MVRITSWLICCGLIIGVLGCGGGGDAGNQAANNNNAPAPAPAGPPPGMAPGAPAPPGMPGAPGAPGAGLTPGGPGAPGAAAATTEAAGPKDITVFLPENTTFAVGGLPAAVAKSTNKVSAAFLTQFSPLTYTLTRLGLPPQNFDSFWAAGTKDLGEQALCVVSGTDLNQDAIKQAIGEGKIPQDSRLWPIPGDTTNTYALAIADARTLIVGKRSTVEAALRKTPPLVIKQGLGTVNQVDADFWMAGDADAAALYFESGLPLLGQYNKEFKDLKAFAVSMILEGKTLTPVTPAAGAPGMGSPYGGAPGGYSGAPMPLGSTGGPMPGGPMPGGYPGTPGAYPGTPGAPGTAPAAPVATEQMGVLMMAGFVFDSEAAATAIKVPLDEFLASGAKKLGPKTGRFAPDLFGNATANTGTTPYGASPGAPGMVPMATGGPPPGYPGTPGATGTYPGMPGAQGGNAAAGSVPVVFENMATGTPTDDFKLKLVPPPPAQIITSTTPPANGAAAAGATPMPGGPMPGAPGAPMGAYAGATTTLPTAPGYGTAPMNYGGASPYPGMGGQGQTTNTGFAGQWLKQQGAIVQLSYRYDATDETVAFAGLLLRALGVSPLADSLSSGPLVALHKAAEQWRGAGAASAVTTANGFGPQGAGWMINLLPFMGHEALYKQFDFSKPLSDSKNARLTHAVIPEFLNPSDPRQQWSGAPYDRLGLSHYVGMSGVEEDSGPPAALLPRNDPKAGIFGYDAIATPDMITDGQSQTIMMIGSGELAGPWSVGGGATIRGARSNSFSPHSGFGSKGASKPGAYVLFADGSVRFVSADVDINVFKAMSTTHGQESVDLQGLQSAGSLAGK